MINEKILQSFGQWLSETEEQQQNSAEILNTVLAVTIYEFFLFTPDELALKMLEEIVRTAQIEARATRIH